MKLLSIFLSVAMAVAVGDEFELTQYLNGRSSASFTRRARNILQVLPPGTKGKVVSAESLPSGNTALRVEITEGSLRGRRFWIYYKADENWIRLRDRNGRDTTNASNARTAETRTSGTAVRDLNQPEENALAAMNQANSALGGHTNGDEPCVTCQAHVSDLSAPRPTTDRNEHPSHGRSCPHYSTAILQCSSSGREPYDYFSFKGHQNGIVYRDWEFEFDNQARQDMHLTLTDRVNERASQDQLSLIYFFPRTYLPRYETRNNQTIVTLPTGEQVTYDSNGNVVGGVLREDGGPQAGTPARIQYTGSGVTIRVNSHNEDPRLAAGSAEIRKGDRTCSVPRGELWPDQSSNSTLGFRFAADSEFSIWLQSRCGFSL